jgi:hypothetical protein
MIYASTYGVSIDASPEANRIGLVAAIAARSSNDEPVILPNCPLETDEIRVGARLANGYNLNLTSGLDLRPWPGGTSRLVQVANQSGLTHSVKFIYITAGTHFRFGIGGTLILDGSDVTNPFEDQSHLVQCIGIASDIGEIYFENVQFRNAGGGNLSGGTGDGLMTAGNPVAIYGIVLKGCTFYNCGRSGISLNVGTRDVLVEDCTFDLTQDAHFDIEQSVAPVISNIRIKGCTFLTNRTGMVAVSIDGASLSATIVDVTIEDCTFVGSGMLHFGWTERLTIRGCTFDPALTATPFSTIHGITRNIDLVLDDCTITHYSENGLEAAVSLAHQYGYGSTGVTISDCTIHQYANSSPVVLEAINDVTIEDTTITHHHVTADSSYGISIRPLINNSADIVIRDVAISSLGGRLIAGILTLPDTFVFGDIDIDRVTCVGCLYAFYAQSTAAGYLAEPQFRGAIADATTTTLVQGNSVSAPVVVVAGNRGNTNQRAVYCYATPEGLVTGPVGCSAFSRQLAATLNKLTGTGATGWG